MMYFDTEIVSKNKSIIKVHIKELKDTKVRYWYYSCLVFVLSTVQDLSVVIPSHHFFHMVLKYPLERAFYQLDLKNKISSLDK